MSSIVVVVATTSGREYGDPPTSEETTTAPRGDNGEVSLDTWEIHVSDKIEASDI